MTEKVTAEQFADDGELAVLHIPTKRRYSTYRYLDPADMSQLNVSKGGGSNDDGFDLEEVDAMAFGVLRSRLAAILKSG
ncbi:hypothetical protein [Devosia sp. CN2-171]|uniref:hypothetical protein n=1 Tax=Devosia sp. CN2-171 TaxID=3400909 RepID=UPI003BF7D684